MKNKLLMIATGMLTLFGLCSCLQTESTITVKKDGSGTIVETVALGEQIQMMMQMAAAQGGQAGQDPMAKMMDKAKAEERAKKMGEGVELVSLEKINENGKLGIKTTYKFSDINKVKYSAGDALNMDMVPGAAKQKAGDAGITFKLAEGKLSIFQKAPAKEGEAPAKEGENPAEEPAINPEMLAMAQGMMKDMRITTKVVIEPGIAKTNATHVEGNTITLADLAMDKIIADPAKLKEIQGGDFDKMKNALKGVDGIKFEENETVEVEMK